MKSVIADFIQFFRMYFVHGLYWLKLIFTDLLIFNMSDQTPFLPHHISYGDPVVSNSYSIFCPPHDF